MKYDITNTTDSVIMSNTNWNDSTENYIKNAPTAKDFALSKETIEAVQRTPSFVAPSGSIVTNGFATAIVTESANKATSLADLKGTITLVR